MRFKSGHSNQNIQHDPMGIFCENSVFGTGGNYQNISPLSLKFVTFVEVCELSGENIGPFPLFCEPGEYELSICVLESKNLRIYDLILE